MRRHVMTAVAAATLGAVGFVVGGCGSGQKPGAAAPVTQSVALPAETYVLTRTGETMTVTVPATTASVTATSLPRPSGAGCVRIFLADGVSAAARAALARRIMRTEDVAKVAYVSKAAALARMKKRNPALVASLKWNPFPASFDVKPASADRRAKIAEAFAGAPGVSRVRVVAGAGCPAP